MQLKSFIFRTLWVVGTVGISAAAAAPNEVPIRAPGAKNGTLPQKKLKLTELSRAPASRGGIADDGIKPMQRGGVPDDGVRPQAPKKPDSVASEVPLPGGYYVPQPVPNAEGERYGGSAGQGKMVDESPARPSGSQGGSGR